MKKGKQPLLYALSSLSSFAIDEGAFYLLMLAFGGMLGDLAATVCSLTARLLSSFYNFNMNRLVFRSRDPYCKALVRYYVLVCAVALAMTLLLNLFTFLFRVKSAEAEVLLKAMIDAALFVLSYFAQKHWVFRKRGDSAGEKEP